MGTGNINANLFFLGEAPGNDEDKQGIPFVGNAGKLLNSIFANAKPEIKREDVFISNVIKCHPPFNTKPSVDKLTTCSTAYLRKELELVRPDLIVCLGGMAAKVLLQDINSRVYELREKVYYTQGPMPQGIPFIVTYHPAATWHQPELLDYIVDDIEWAQKLVTGELPKPMKKRKYIKLDSIRKIPDIDKAKWIDLDLETDGLDPFLPNKEILSCQISIKEGEGYYFDWSEKIKTQLARLLESNKVYVNGHNIKHDLKWLRIIAGIIFDGRINDTIQNLHLLNENFPSKSLDTVATTFTPLKGHKKKHTNLIREYVKQNKLKKEPIRRAMARLYKYAYFSVPEKFRINYGCGDADAAGMLRRNFRPKLKEQGLMPLHNLIMEATKMYLDMECNGMRIDEQKLPVFEARYKKKIDKQLAKMDTLAPYSLSHNAPLQVKELLYSRWKCIPHEIRMGKKRVRYTTAKDALELILKDNIDEPVRKYIQALLSFRKDSKLQSTYILGMPRFLRNGIIHASWRLDGADTGRDSCSEPNLQQIPRKGDIKKLFISRFKYGVLASLDVSQGELRIGAHEANEKRMIELFNTGTTDIHTTMAAVLLGIKEKDVTEDQRYAVKQVNFLIFYGGGVKTMQQEISSETSISEGEAYNFIHKWNREFPGIAKWKKEVEIFIVKNHYIRNLFGRYRHLFIIDPDSEEGKKQLRQGINAPIQGGLADYNRLCGTKLWRRLQKEGLDKKCLIIAAVHDQFLFDCKNRKIAERAMLIGKEEFENVDTSEFGFKFKIPMKVEIKIGINWKEMEVYDAPSN